MTLDLAQASDRVLDRARGLVRVRGWFSAASPVAELPGLAIPGCYPRISRSTGLIGG